MGDWHAAATFYRGRIAANPAFDVVGDMFASRAAWNQMADRPNNWFELIKTIRHVFGNSIEEAHRMILGHSGFRRLVQQAIDTNLECARYARSGIRKGWLAGLAELQGERPVIALTWRSPLPRI